MGTTSSMVTTANRIMPARSVLTFLLFGLLCLGPSCTSTMELGDKAAAAQEWDRAVELYERAQVEGEDDPGLENKLRQLRKAAAEGHLAKAEKHFSAKRVGDAAEEVKLSLQYSETQNAADLRDQIRRTSEEVEALLAEASDLMAPETIRSARDALLLAKEKWSNHPVVERELQRAVQQLRQAKTLEEEARSFWAERALSRADEAISASIILEVTSERMEMAHRISSSIENAEKTIGSAWRNFEAQEYEAAKAAFSEVLLLWADHPTARDGIDQCNREIEFASFCDLGGKALSSGDWPAAILEFEAALQIKSAPEVSALLAEAKSCWSEGLEKRACEAASMGLIGHAALLALKAESVNPGGGAELLASDLIKRCKEKSPIEATWKPTRFGEEASCTVEVRESPNPDLNARKTPDADLAFKGDVQDVVFRRVDATLLAHLEDRCEFGPPVDTTPLADGLFPHRIRCEVEVMGAQNITVPRIVEGQSRFLAGTREVMNSDYRLLKEEVDEISDEKFAAERRLADIASVIQYSLDHGFNPPPYKWAELEKAKRECADLDEALDYNARLLMRTPSTVLEDEWATWVYDKLSMSVEIRLSAELRIMDDSSGEIVSLYQFEDSVIDTDEHVAPDPAHNVAADRLELRDPRDMLSVLAGSFVKGIEREITQAISGHGDWYFQEASNLEISDGRRGDLVMRALCSNVLTEPDRTEGIDEVLRGQYSLDPGFVGERVATTLRRIDRD